MEVLLRDVRRGGRSDLVRHPKSGRSRLAHAPPGALTPLVWIPTAELVALAFFRPTERYGHLAVDGALLAGALATLVHQALA